MATFQTAASVLALNEVNLCIQTFKRESWFPIVPSGFHRCPSHGFSNLIVGPHLFPGRSKAIGPSVELLPSAELEFLLP